MTYRMQGRNAAYVIEALTSAVHPMSAYDIIAAVRPRAELAPTTVYRALRQLVSEGKAHRIESLNAFVACQHGHGAKSAHQQGDRIGFVICNRCGSVDEFIDPLIGEKVAATLVELGFSISTVTLELRGFCAKCSDKALAR